jgi:hypothetical protein
MPKLTVITNSVGEIVGTANFSGDKGTPTSARLLGAPNTTVHEIEVADDVLHLSASELHLKLQQTYMSAVRTAK